MNALDRKRAIDAARRPWTVIPDEDGETWLVQSGGDETPIGWFYDIYSARRAELDHNMWLREDSRTVRYRKAYWWAMGVAAGLAVSLAASAALDATHKDYAGLATEGIGLLFCGAATILALYLMRKEEE